LPVKEQVSKPIKMDKDIGTAKPMPTGDQPIQLAKWMEQNGKPAEAAKIYERELKAHPFREHNYNRLMMIYRKNKDYRNELRIINTGINAFTEYYKPESISNNKSVARLSRQLNKLVGLTDEKGNSLFDAGPIGKWKMRKGVVLKKLKRLKE
jgi:hypothetical protein